MNKIGKFFTVGMISTLIFFNTVLPINAAYSLFGEASVVAGGNPGNAVQTVSDNSPAYGGLDFDDLNGSVFSTLTNLATDFNVTDDNCGAGSPRFYISLDTNGDSVHDGNIFVYLGDFPNYNSCTPNTWVSSGNLIVDPDSRWDTSQVNGTFYDTHTNALILAGTGTILEIGLVIDSSWNTGATGGDGEQTVLFDNVEINGNVHDFEPEPPGPFDVPEQCSDIDGLGEPIVGTEGSDKINGTSGNDLIFGLGGSDKIDGKGGDDCIVGGDGSDKLIGGTGNDVLLGGTGSDSLEGGGDNDELYGEEDSDSLKGGSGNDILSGGDNSDSLKGDSGHDELFGGEGSDSLKGGSGNDELTGDGGVDSAHGGGGNDTCSAESVKTCES